MRIALFGYGKMGKMIEAVATDRGHLIVAKIDIGTTKIDFDNMDVAIDFSTPDAAFENITNCFEHGIPVISGTTGWLERFDEAVGHCKKMEGAFIYASNFSLGVNVFFELNSYLAKMMRQLKTYKVAMEEIHHTEKLDAPSGTAITLAEGILANSDYRRWNTSNAGEFEIPITSKRIGQVPGTHSILYTSEVDQIEIKHTAHSREGFALGAIVAAEWLVGKKGVYGMKDVLGL
ncbi:MAG: 4-hydroxy-tetrahydrodipicolinate reductase [Flavobacteriales bacterium]|nr:MAG: 4-hydroxy-tetrahydrodipicolinate reductase [Flavobacteriales bacterium]